MLRPTDQEMTAIEKTVIFTDLKRWGQAMPGGEDRTWWAAPRLVRRGEGENYGPEPLLWFL